MKPVSLHDLPAPPAGKTGWPWTEAPVAKSGLPPDSLPSISIVTPSYNQGAFLEATIRSILLQHYPHLEYYVMDGGSTDESLSIIEKYKDFLDGWCHEKDEGQSDAINKGFSRCSGSVYGWLNSDDGLMPGALQKIAGAYHKAPDAACWIGATTQYDAMGNAQYSILPWCPTVEGLGSWPYGGFFYQPGCFFQSEIFHKTGGLDVSLDYTMDLDLWYKLMLHGEPVILQELLAFVHMYPETKTRSNRSMREAEYMYLNFRYDQPALARERLHRFVDDEYQIKIKSMPLGDGLHAWDVEDYTRLLTVPQMMKLTARRILELPGKLVRRLCSPPKPPVS